MIATPQCCLCGSCFIPLTLWLAVVAWWMSQTENAPELRIKAAQQKKKKERPKMKSKDWKIFLATKILMFVQQPTAKATDKTLKSKQIN